MEHEVPVDQSGRVPIPGEVRIRRRLAAGTRMVLVEESDRLVLLRVDARTATAEGDDLAVFDGRLDGPDADHRAHREARLDRLARP